MNDVTRILANIEAGGEQAMADLLPLVYAELRKIAAAHMAAERPDHTLQSTALVHEAFLRLVGTDRGHHWENRAHFFTAAAEAMRRILIESARRKHRQKRGFALQRLAPETLDGVASTSLDPGLVIDIDDGLTRLAEEDAEAAELAKLRFFAGLSVSEAGEMLGMSRTSAYRTWDYVRSWFAVHYRSGADL